MVLVSNNDQKLQDFIIDNLKGIKYDELCVLTGFVGLGPIEKVSKLQNIKTTIIFGLAEEVLTKELKQCLVEYHSNYKNNVSIYAPRIKSHSKIYIWKRKGEIVYALTGSANFSSKGLLSNNREILIEIDKKDLKDINNYYLKIFKSSVSINEIKIVKEILKQEKLRNSNSIIFENEITSPSLFSPKSNINWGHSNAKNNKRDSCIPINVSLIENFPNVFLPKTNNRGLGYADNDPFDILWDDGEKMIGLFEGTQSKNNLRYPNKISTYKDKKILGDYLRKRMNIKPGEFVSKDDFEKYGRDNITIKQIGEGQLYFDFSNNK